MGTITITNYFLKGAKAYGSIPFWEPAHHFFPSFFIGQELLGLSAK